MLKRSCKTFLAMLAIAAAAAGCSAQPAPTAVESPAAGATAAARPATAAPRATLVPQAVPTAAAPTSAPTAAAATAAPTGAAQSATGALRFTHPTEITNPFYPVSLTQMTIALGQEGGKPSRNEVTLLPDTKMIAWQGQPIEARVAQFVAYVDGRLVEVAYDYFAQADDGSVYYLGEDVSNYADGKLANHEGSWLTGKDGAPPALIMPAQPAVGEIFNPENLPGVVYETDEILNLAQKTMTPDGPTDQGILVKETLMDGSIEHKVYALNYGITEDRADDEQVYLVLFERAGTQPGSVPGPLSTIEAQAEDIIDVVPGGGWQQADADVAAIAKAWESYQPRAASDHVPQPFQAALTAALDRLRKASAARQAAGTLQAANDLSAAVMDVFAAFHPAVPPDLGRLDVHERQVALDLASNDAKAAADSLAKIGAVWARLKPAILAHSGADVAGQFEHSLAAQQDALGKRDTAALKAEAARALELVDALEKLF